MTLDYETFLRSKRTAVKASGFDQVLSTNPKLFPFQADVVRWALKLGKAALFERCGLGKTAQQLEWAYHVCDHTGGDVLILAPFSVGSQTRKEGIKFGIDVTVCRTQADVKTGINITNYEMLKHFDVSKFAGVVLDESSALKNYSGKIKKEVIDTFRETPYKLACTATPAPNDHMELGNHAEFLDVMGSNEMLARWFINDTMEAGAYRLKGHATDDFWRWVASWAVCLTKPSDLGYSDEGFDLPPLHIIPEVVNVDVVGGAEDGMLFRMPELSATTNHKEGRITVEARAARVVELVNSKPTEAWAIWCETNYEADAILAIAPWLCEVRGSEKPEVKTRKLESFVSGEARCLLTKPKIAGWGLNFQHASHMIFARPSFSWESIHQTMARMWRFRQTRPVHAYMIMAETEAAIFANYSKKQVQYETMQLSMSKALAETGLSLAGGCGPTKYAPGVAMMLPNWLRSS